MEPAVIHIRPLRGRQKVTCETSVICYQFKLCLRRIANLFPFTLSQSLFQLPYPGIQTQDEEEIDQRYYAQWHHGLVGDASDDIRALG